MCRNSHPGGADSPSPSQNRPSSVWRQAAESRDPATSERLAGRSAGLAARCCGRAQAPAPARPPPDAIEAAPDPQCHAWRPAPWRGEARPDGRREARASRFPQAVPPDAFQDPGDPPLQRGVPDGALRRAGALAARGQALVERDAGICGAGGPGIPDRPPACPLSETGAGRQSRFPSARRSGSVRPGAKAPKHGGSPCSPKGLAAPGRKAASRARRGDAQAGALSGGTAWRSR